MNTKKLFPANEFLLKKLGPMSVSMFMRAFREADGVTQSDFAKLLGISKANLCDIEKGRKLVSAERAAKFAKQLQVPEVTLIKLALQDLLRSAQLKYTVDLKRVS